MVTPKEIKKKMSMYTHLVKVRVFCSVLSLHFICERNFVNLQKPVHYVHIANMLLQL